MTAATIFKSAGTCTDTTQPFQPRDPAASAGSLFCYDALDPYSWPTQAAPTGTGPLVDLLDHANATIGVQAMGWANGFVFDSADTDRITLPASSKVASDAAGFGLTFWVKFASVAAGNKGVLDLSDDTAGSTQYGMYRSAADLVVRVDGSTFAAQAIAAMTVYQVGVTSVLLGGTYTHTLWLNGVAVKTTTTSSPFVQPAKAACVIGTLAAVDANGDNFTFYRCHADNLSTRTAAQFIAADYAAGVGRF